MRTSERFDLVRRRIQRRALEGQKQDGGDSGARLMHRDISADYWSITRDNFESFMAIVREGLASGSLVISSPDTGPNMYQVNDQVIKKVAAADPQLPGMSWAFKDGRIGAQVTIFVTQARQEGAFEFERQLEHGWSVRNGSHGGATYICFLSTPPNLDIGGLLENIDTSPFQDRMPKAVGLMIMCLTINGAIHKGAIFEAYMAREQGIRIAIPGSGVYLAEHQAGAMDEAANVQAHQQLRIVRGNSAKDAGIGALINLDTAGLFYCVGKAVCKTCRDEVAEEAAEDAARQAGDGHLVDVRRAACSNPDDRGA
mmetsp:Transcript_146654/g.381180  ORF Transcript_146654/g.381180 Transcript_146654/m.381180 type:complete len:312 (+) Transcript_146654:421-1356(+)